MNRPFAPAVRLLVETDSGTTVPYFYTWGMSQIIHRRHAYAEKEHWLIFNLLSNTVYFSS